MKKLLIPILSLAFVVGTGIGVADQARVHQSNSNPIAVFKPDTSAETDLTASTQEAVDTAPIDAPDPTVQPEAAGTLPVTEVTEPVTPPTKTLTSQAVQYRISATAGMEDAYCVYSFSDNTTQEQYLGSRSTATSKAKVTFQCQDWTGQ